MRKLILGKFILVLPYNMYRNNTFTGRLETLNGSEYHFCEFDGVDFTDATINKCQFFNCTFDNVNFSGARVGESTFTACSFNKPNFAGATLVAKFKDCVIGDADCSGTDMSKITFTGGKFGQRAVANEKPKTPAARQTKLSIDDLDLDALDREFAPAKKAARTRASPSTPPAPKRTPERPKRTPESPMHDVVVPAKQTEGATKKMCDVCGRNNNVELFNRHIKVHEHLGISCTDSIDGCPRCGSHKKQGLAKLLDHMERCYATADETSSDEE